MAANARMIELDRETADRLEAWARKRGVTVAELLAELATGESTPSPNWEALRKAGRGPWTPDILAEDVRRLEDYERTGEGVPWHEVESWIQSWGTARELPPPKPRKL